MKILIDARLYGLENAGLGRYTMNLVAELSKLDRKNSYIILLRKKYFDELTLPSNWKKVLVDIKHYSLAEQIELPGMIKKENPDLTHFLHFDVPLIFRGRFIVTIHDMLMHKFAGLSATTLPALVYFIKQLIYRLIFRKAVLASEKIIVPSEAVKKEILEYYKIDKGKIEVIYE